MAESIERARFWLRDLCGPSAADIAHAIGVTVGQITRACDWAEPWLALPRQPIHDAAVQAMDTVAAFCHPRGEDGKNTVRRLDDIRAKIDQQADADLSFAWAAFLVAIVSICFIDGQAKEA